MVQDATPFVTADDVAFYRRHGWWLSPPIIAEEVLDGLAFGVERYAAGERDWALPVNLGQDGGGDAVAQVDYLSLQIDEFRHATAATPVAAVAAALAEVAGVRLFHDQLVTKPPYDPGKPAVVGWHADKAYWTTCSSDRMITAWIPLDDVPLEKGPLAVWDGSHGWPGTDVLHSFQRQDLATIEEGFRARGLEPQILSLPMRRGQVSFHHCRLVHGGFPNRTDTPRHGYAIHFQDAANHFVPHAASAGRRGHVNDLICRRTADGLPDYADPDVFPRLWP